MKNAKSKANEKAAIKMDIAKNINIIKPAAATIATKEQLNLAAPLKAAEKALKRKTLA